MSLYFFKTDVLLEIIRSSLLLAVRNLYERIPEFFLKQGFLFVFNAAISYAISYLWKVLIRMCPKGYGRKKEEMRDAETTDDAETTHLLPGDANR